MVLAYHKGAQIRLPNPTRKSYTFRFWKGSKYKVGQTYTVKGDHTFKAQWKKNSPGAGDGKEARPKHGSPSGEGKNDFRRRVWSARTGDDGVRLIWIALAVLMTAIAGIIIIRRKVSKK